MIIDLSEFLARQNEAPGQKPTPVDTTGAQAVPPVGAPDRSVEIVRTDGFEACLHRSMAIDDKQRTVKCGTCGIWLDPVWCLRELFHYYQTRIDHRLEHIKEWDAKQKAADERKAKRVKQPRRSLIERRAETMQRAAYNEYQAKVLALRAERQRALAVTLDAAIAVTEPTTDENRRTS